MVTRNWNPDMQRRLLRKLLLIHSAEDINDLRIPPGNELQKVNSNLIEYWTININDQWQVLFRWIDNHAHDVGIIGYHQK